MLHDWSVIEKEQLSPGLARQVVHTGNMTVARIFVAKSAIVPRHSHVNEQITMIAEGKLKFMYDDHEQIIGEGQLLVTPPNVPHSVVALEDSLAIDIFTPQREDWITGDDAYLRGR